MGFVVISEELGFVIPHLTESDAIEYAKSRAQSRPFQLEIYDIEGRLVRRTASYPRGSSIPIVGAWFDGE